MVVSPGNWNRKYYFEILSRSCYTKWLDDFANDKQNIFFPSLLEWCVELVYILCAYLGGHTIKIYTLVCRHGADLPMLDSHVLWILDLDSIVQWNGSALNHCAFLESNGNLPTYILDLSWKTPQTPASVSIIVNALILQRWIELRVCFQRKHQQQQISIQCVPLVNVSSWNVHEPKLVYNEYSQALFGNGKKKCIYLCALNVIGIFACVYTVYEVWASAVTDSGMANIFRSIDISEVFFYFHPKTQ